MVRVAICLAFSLTACVPGADRTDTPTGVDAHHSRPSNDAGVETDLSGSAEQDSSTPRGDDATSDAGPDVPSAALQHLLPIEVIGPPGTAASVEVILDEAPSPEANARLELQIHNIVADDSALVWINERGPYDLSTPEADGGFARRRGGTVSGLLDIPGEALVEGPNTITFQYTRQVPDVSGFRVLHVGIRIDERTYFGPADFVDPADWQPFDDTEEALARGESYFTEVSRDGGPVCAKCHADSGADLEYYAFSNHAIVERAMFHEFSREEARDIASYIRSLDVPRDGRVYAPPFQPGADNVGAAGAGLEAVLESDDALGQHLFGESGLPTAWDWAADVDTYTVPTALEVPTWFRWLPREIDEQWFTMRDGALAEAERRLSEEPTMENAHEFMSAAVAIGKEIMALQGDHQGRIELLRFAAVKLWDWSRKHGFYDEDHGFPNDEYGDRDQWGSPAYPYEVGFAFFEAASAGHPDAMEQAIEWWIVQVALDPGRGRSNGNRPLDYRDVLIAAESNVGPRELAWLYLLGSWEESRGTMRDAWGTPTGPVRLLEIVMPPLDAEHRTTLWLRHLGEESRRDVPVGPEHHTMLSNAWAASCPEMTDAQQQSVRAAVPRHLQPDFEACQ